jgi:hypothetical protein
MCKYAFGPVPLIQGSGIVPPDVPVSTSFDAWMDKIKLVGYGVDTLVLNVRYADENLQPIQKELDGALMRELDYLQTEAKRTETAIATDWSFLDTLLFIEPHGAGRQWRWLLSSRLLSLVVSRGKFNDVIAQVRFSSEFLWSEEWCGDALSKVHEFLAQVFGERLHLQVSYVDLCADLMGYDFSLSNYEQHFITRGRKQSVVYGTDAVNLDNRSVSYLRFSSSASPISCRIYNKTLEITQKSQKTWFYDLWRKGVSGPFGGSWDGSSDVWRIEFHLKREFLHNLTGPIEGAYDLLDQFQPLWMYAAGQGESEDGLFDGWLRYVVPSDDSNRTRWPLHPAWVVVQSAFTQSVEAGLGPVVRERIREKNIERGVAAMIGYSSTLAAWLGGEFAVPETDMSVTLQWLYGAGQEYLAEKNRDFVEEVRKKQIRFNSENGG